MHRSWIRKNGAILVAGLALSTAAPRVSLATDLGFLWRATDAELGSIKWGGLIINPDVGYETLKLKGAGKSVLDDPRGWRAGAEIGYDLQFGNVIVGAAADGFYAWIEGKGTGAGTGRYEADLAYFGTLRTRMGFAHERWMGYATGGWAFGQLEVRDTANALQDKKFLSGWALGGGVEYVWNRSMTLRAEYMHIDFGKPEFSSLPAASSRIGAEMDMLKLGMVMRF